MLILPLCFLRSSAESSSESVSDVEELNDFLIVLYTTLSSPQVISPGACLRVQGSSEPPYTVHTHRGSGARGLSQV